MDLSPPGSLPRPPRPGRRQLRGRRARNLHLGAKAATVTLVVVTSACGPSGDPDLSIGEARASERLAGAAQVVLDVDNQGDGDDLLVDATTPVAIGTEIHLTTIDDDGRATMDTIDEVTIPAGEVTRFRPGGLHLMLTVPDESVVVGGTFELTLHFEVSGDVTVPVTVVEQHELLEDAASRDEAEDPDPGAPTSDEPDDQPDDQADDEPDDQPDSDDAEPTDP